MVGRGPPYGAGFSEGLFGGGTIAVGWHRLDIADIPDYRRVWVPGGTYFLYCRYRRKATASAD